MGRPVDPLAQYRIKTHVNGRYTYASTQPPYIDQKTGKKKYRYIHWGKVDENLKFKPGTSFWLASPEERAMLIFPDNWDMSEATKSTGLRHPGRPTHDDECQNRLHGEIWLLEQVAMKTGIRQDLNAVFDGNRELVDDILTLAMFSYLTSHAYDRVARWQRAVKTPSSRELTPTAITRLTQSITERHRMELFKLRASRLGTDELCAIDSTSRSAYGESLADARWGHDKERLPLKQTTEVVVCSLTSHMPIYHGTFPSNLPDSRSLDTILTDLDRAGFKNLLFITSRGHDTPRDLEKCILRGQRMIMCVKTSQKEVTRMIDGLGAFGGAPEAMEIDPDAKLYHKQNDIEYVVEAKGAAVKAANQLRLNLYFDPVRKARELIELDIAVTLQRTALEELMKNRNILDDGDSIKRDYDYFNVVLEPATMEIKSFTLKERKVRNDKKVSGYFSIMSHGVDYGAMETYRTYRFRDEQEKCLQQMKDWMVSDWQRNWSEEGKTGRLFILFVAMILNSHIRHVWKSTRLRDIFSSSLEMVDEMKPIRCIEHTNRAKEMTPFVGAQVDICEVFGFAIPENCTQTNKSRQQPRRKRGLPAKSRVKNSF